MTEPTDFLNRADELAPSPDNPHARPTDWVRHYAAQAMAANAAFRVAERTSPGPALGYLSALEVASTHAAMAIDSHSWTTRDLWEVTPEGGALNGEWMDYLAEVLVKHDINPADLYPWYRASDFPVPLRLPKLEVPQ
jgi:hypothetical protein